MKEKAVKRVKNKWLIAFVIIGVLMFIARKPLAVFIGWLSGIDVDNGINAGDLLRSSILLLGVIGGAYGLYLSTKRQKTFSDQVQGQSKQVQVLSEQVKVQADQSFNDRLGRGLELLKDEKKDEKNVVMRCAGLQVLEDLADNANDRQRAIILNIIYNFFRDNAKVNRDHENGSCPRTQEETTQDLQDALDVLAKLSLDEREKLLPKRLVDGRLDFRNLDFSHMEFNCKTLEQINFSDSCFSETAFHVDEIKDVELTSARFMIVEFKNTKFENIKFDPFALIGHEGTRDVCFTRVNFKDVEFVNFDFIFVHFERSNFMNVRIENIKFIHTDCLIGTFHTQNRVKISSESSLPNFIGYNIWLKQFTFNDDVDPNHFFKLCYHPKGQESSKMDSSRGYEKGTHGHEVFVKSTKDWSEQPAREWVLVEVAKWKLKHVESPSPISGMIDEEKVAKVKFELEHVKKLLDSSQEALGLPKKMPK